MFSTLFEQLKHYLPVGPGEKWQRCSITKYNSEQ